jgi:nucleoside-diphosphate-sugar epimerase
VFNVGGADITTHLDMAKFVRAYRGTSVLADLLPDRGRITRRYRMPYEIERIRRVLDFTPAIPMQDGLAEILENRDRSRSEEARVPARGRAAISVTE